jgi:peptidyl-prolyl cis-trans isomerase D
MLTTIRERAQGWIAWVIVILISVPFALWGINEYFDAEKKVVVAEINGNELMSQDFQQQLQRQRNVIRQQFGGKIDNKIFESPAFKQRVLNEMITQRLVTADLQKQNYQIGDQQLASLLRSNPAFQTNGSFSPELYAQAVRSNGLSPSAFEGQIRMGNIVGQVMEGFTRSIISNDAELDDLLRLQQEKRNFRSLALTGKSFIDKIDINEADIKQHYDSNKKQYMTPEEVRVEYITLSLANVAEQIQPDEEALRTFYQESKDQYIQAEQRKAQHILLAIASDANDEEIKRVEELASDLTSQAHDNKDFSELAKKFSVDSISSENGGDLGYFERGVMDAAFDEKVFSMQKDEISGPVRSRFGIHIIKLNDIRPETGKSFDEVKEQISKQYALREAALRYGQMAEEFQNIVYEQPTTLQPAADALGLKMAATEWFSRAGGQGIAEKRPFIDSAFTEDVLLEGLNSEVVETSEDTLIALRLLKHREPQQKQLADVSDEIKQMLINQRSKELAAKEATRLIKALQSEETTLAQLAESEGLQLVDHEEVTRNEGNTSLSPALLREIFRSSVNAAGKDSAAGSVQLENGDYAIFSVTKILPGNPQDVAEEIRNQIRLIIKQRKGEDLFSDYERGLYELSDIIIHEDKL